jgi:hypothetical protein
MIENTQYAIAIPASDHTNNERPDKSSSPTNQRMPNRRAKVAKSIAPRNTIFVRETAVGTRRAE